MSRVEKKNQVSQIEEIYNSSNAVVITHYHGLSVTEITQLRKDLREAGAGFKVVKNTLSKIAAKNVGVEIDEEMFAGPSAIAYSEDPIAAAKGIMKFAKANDNLKVVGGIVNEQILDVSGIETLAKLPSLDEIRGKLVGILQAPAAQIARIVQAPAGQVARVIKAHSDKG